MKRRIVYSAGYPTATNSASEIETERHNHHDAYEYDCFDHGLDLTGRRAEWVTQPSAATPRGAQKQLFGTHRAAGATTVSHRPERVGSGMVSFDLRRSRRHGSRADDRRSFRLAPAFGRVAVLFGLSVILLPATAKAAPLAFGRCGASQLAAPAPGVECAALEVPLDRTDPGVGSVSLAVQRVPASAPQVGTIVVLAGGPGQAALPIFDSFFAPLAKLAALRGYELVAFDQRGTGQSGVLSCPRLLREGPRALAACGGFLGAARSDYTSQDSVEDLEALREALGGPPLSLYAVSYGTKVAGMYAREDPAGVARMVLDSPVPLAGSDALGRERLRALPRVLDQEICGGGGCRDFAPHPDGELVRLVDLLHRRPLRARIFNASGRRETVSISEAGLYGAITVMDLSPGLRVLVPAAVASALRGHLAPLARLVGRPLAASPTSSATRPVKRDGISGLPTEALSDSLSSQEEAINRELSVVLLASTLCVESPLPWAPESPPASRAQSLRNWLALQPANSTAPFTAAVAASQGPIPICLGWPSTPAAPVAPSGISATPTLILSGDDDLRTPYEQDLQIASGYSDVQLLRIPATGHSTVSSDATGCAKQAMIEFLSAAGAPSSCPAPTTPQVLPPPPTSLSQLARAHSRSTLAGRGATAAALTIAEILAQPQPSGGGLQGGSYHLAGTRVIFKHLSDIPDISLTGSLDLSDLTGRLVIQGRVHGALRLKGSTLTGRLDGAAVKTRLWP